MIRFKFEDQEIELPTGWDEVTVGMYVTDHFLSGDVLSLLSALSGIERVKLLNTTEDLMPHFAKVALFLHTEPFKDAPVPESVKIMDKICPIPKEIEMERFGQKILLGQAIEKHNKHIQAMPEAIAIYLSPYIFKDWDNHLEEVAEVVRTMDIGTIYPIANFFLENFLGYRLNGAPS